MSGAREEILGRIRKAIDRTPADQAAEWARVPRRYRRVGSDDADARIRLFVDRLEDYGSAVRHCRADEISSAIAEALASQGKRCLLIPNNLPGEWLPTAYEFKRDEALTYQEIDRSDGVLTGCATAIALTGTIVLRHSAAEGRRALSLIPDYHLCVVFEDQVVETVCEGIERMEAFRSDPITTISGPSATSDIEMTRIKGVHGPRTLEVVLVSAR